MSDISPNPSPPNGSEDRRDVLAHFAQNLQVAIQAVLQRPKLSAYFRASLVQFFVLSLVLWILSAVDDLITVDFVGALSIWGLIGDAALNYFWLVAVGIVVLLLGSPRYFLPLAVGTAAVSIVITLVWIPATHVWEHTSPASYHFYFSHAWWLTIAIEIGAFYRILSWYCPLGVQKRLALSWIYAGIIFLSVWYLPPQPLFSAPWESSTANDLNVEDIYYAQSNLMNQALYEIAPETEGQVDIYNIGFAAYGPQDVFYREVESALEILSTRFNSTNKALALINNPATVDNAPMANEHNLRRAIREISKKMNLDEDILLLFLSSHGSENASISVTLSGLRLNDVNAESVRSALDESNVYWRIVIVSACYSGSFIEALKSPTTLIITAAAADKTSFGCDHIRDWTYFGEAFFTQALPADKTFVASFNTAREILRKRELEEGKEPSEPQLWLGEAIKAYLTLHAL